MSPTRRDFLATGLRAGVAASVVGPGAAAAATTAESHTSAFSASAESVRRSRALRILILGGTGVTGPHLVAEALERGHEVTTFTRGRTEPAVNRDAFDEVEQLLGDRSDDLEALRGRRWDVAIDNSGQRVEWTTASAELLQDQVETYVYTSSTGVYYPYLGYDIDEDTELLTEVPAHAAEDEQGVYGYGVMKANSEAESRRIFGEDRTLVIRPTYIMGPGDTTDRFTYWPVRIARGGRVVVPGGAEDPVQFIDSRDLSRFVLDCLEDGTTGTFNLAGPHSRMGMHAFVHGVHAAFNSPVEWIHVDDPEFLREHGIQYVIPWILPYGNNWGSPRIDNGRAVEAGLTFRPLAASVRDIHEWWRTDAVSDERRTRMAERTLMGREEEVVAAWRGRE